MVADRYAGEGFSSSRTVRERYDIPPPKEAAAPPAAANDGNGSARTAARARATSRG